MGIDYVTIDVFADTQFGGNPLAVIPDARALDDSLMQKIATEFNYSEVTFVFPPSDPANTAKVRIFTPTEELPFAGHPNVGTAFVLGRQGSVFGKTMGEEMTFEEKSGLVRTKLLRNNGEVCGASITAPSSLKVGDEVDSNILAACLSLKPSNFLVNNHKPNFASVGLPFILAELDNLDSLASIRPNAGKFSEASKQAAQANGRFSVYLYVRDLADKTKFRARMIAKDTIEDPATGSAAGALAAYITHIDQRPAFTNRLIIEQGVEMNRRSLIELEALKVGIRVDKVSIAGQCIPVMRGTIEAVRNDQMVRSDHSLVQTLRPA